MEIDRNRRLLFAAWLGVGPMLLPIPVGLAATAPTGLGGILGIVLLLALGWLGSAAWVKGRPRAPLYLGWVVGAGLLLVGALELQITAADVRAAIKPAYPLWVDVTLAGATATYAATLGDWALSRLAALFFPLLPLALLAGIAGTYSGQGGVAALGFGTVLDWPLLGPWHLHSVLTCLWLFAALFETALIVTVTPRLLGGTVRNSVRHVALGALVMMLLAGINPVPNGPSRLALAALIAAAAALIFRLFLGFAAKEAVDA